MSNVARGTAKQRLIDRIQAGKIVDRFNEFAKAKTTDKNYKEVEMSMAQINAGRTLLNKVVPDLKQVEQFIKDERKKTRVEVDAALIAQGIDPATVWKQVTHH